MRKSSKVRTNILNSLANGEFKVGDQLPPESVLIQKFDMSRASLREGLASLVQEGILSRRRGAGTFVARTEAQPRLKVVAAIVNSEQNRQDSTGQLVRAMEEELHAAGYSLILCNHSDEPARMKQYVDRILQQQVSGVLLHPLEGPSDSREHNLAAIRELENHGIPFVLIGTLASKDTSHRYSIVSSNGYESMREMVRHLARLGHSKIAYIHFTNSATADDRFSGYLDQMQQQNLPLPKEYVQLLEPVAVEQQGQREVRNLLQLPTPPTAVICVHDFIACNVIQEVHRLGLRVPQDLAVVGFGDMPIATFVNPTLTTIRTPVKEEGQSNTRMLLKKINHQFVGEQQTFLPCKLVIRESCGAPGNLRTTGCVDACATR